MARRTLFAIAGLALTLHLLGMLRCLTPAQDGLKFIRVARQFRHQPWDDVVRGSDQHPLYSALIALAEPPVALVVGEGPDAWRIAAQLVSVLASLATIPVLFGFARSLFGERQALLATLVYVLLPIPGAIGRDTLSDSLALLFFATTLRLGEAALRTGDRRSWIGCGLAAGFGYLVRPEILIVPTAVAMTAGLSWLTDSPRRPAADPTRRRRPILTEVGSLGIATLAIVGCYAIVKGELSEKPSVRIGGSPGTPTRGVRKVPLPLPKGLDDARWDFAPKEEASEIHIRGSLRKTILRLVQQWAEGLGWVLLPLFAWGLLRAGSVEGSRVGRRLVGVYLVLFSAIVVRHATTHGYLSGRHALTMVLATVPWVGAGIWAWVRSIPLRRGLGPRSTRRLAVAGLTGLISLGVTVQVKAMHPSRWGHWAAGQYLKKNAKPADSVLDTRGFASFVRGGPGYDYWHVRQAFTDASLAYVVVGTDELRAGSRRAATLRAILDYAGTPVAEFPERDGHSGVGVRVYRFHRPESWEGLRP